MAGQFVGVTTKGLDELSGLLRDLAERLGHEIDEASEKVAGEIVEGAKDRAAGLPGLAPASFAGLTENDGKIVLDGTRFPTLLGDEFGARRFPQFEPWRGNSYADALEQNVGYALHPELRARQRFVIDFYLGVIDDLLERIARG